MPLISAMSLVSAGTPAGSTLDQFVLAVLPLTKAEPFSSALRRQAIVIRALPANVGPPMISQSLPTVPVTFEASTIDAFESVLPSKAGRDGVRARSAGRDDVQAEVRSAGELSGKGRAELLILGIDWIRAADGRVSDVGNAIEHRNRCIGRIVVHGTRFRGHHVQAGNAACRAVLVCLDRQAHRCAPPLLNVVWLAAHLANLRGAVGRRNRVRRLARYVEHAGVVGVRIGVGARHDSTSSAGDDRAIKQSASGRRNSDGVAYPAPGNRLQNTRLKHCGRVREYDRGHAGVPAAKRLAREQSRIARQYRASLTGPVIELEKVALTVSRAGGRSAIEEHRTAIRRRKTPRDARAGRGSRVHGEIA